MEQTCIAKFYKPGHFHALTCGRKAKVEREDEWYCGTHDPVARKEKYDERTSALLEISRIEGLKDNAATKERQCIEAAAKSLDDAGITEPGGLTLVVEHFESMAKDAPQGYRDWATSMLELLGVKGKG